MGIATILSLLIGAWGALLSTYLAVRMRRQDRRTLVVHVETGYAQKYPQGIQEIVTAVNEGRRPVQVKRFIFQLGSKGYMMDLPPADPPAVQDELPKVLGEHDSATRSYPKSIIDGLDAEGDNAVAAVVEDASHRKYLAPYPPPK